MSVNQKDLGMGRKDSESDVKEWTMYPMSESERVDSLLTKQANNN